MTDSDNGQVPLDMRPEEMVGEVLARIRKQSRSESEKGRWFEHLFMAVVRDNPEFDVAEIWTWRDWPTRDELTGLDSRDIGIDLVAELNDGTLVAVQCKCFADGYKVAKDDIDSFMNASAREPFGLRWVVSTTEWTETATKDIRDRTPPVQRIDFLDYLYFTIKELGRPERREPKPLQEGAIEKVVDGLKTQGNSRGKLIMACGTGKTFVSLRASEQIVPDKGRILFAAPSISLVSQARREWLSYTDRDMASLVVCSDRSAGGRGSRLEVGPDDLVCPVETDPHAIREHLQRPEDVKVVFCTYQSLDKVIAAQKLGDVAPFDLAIADEAHRTTGVDRGDRTVNFRLFHDQEQLNANKRLYMTATPRIYTPRSIQAQESQGAKVVDMNNQNVYGPELCRVRFKDAVNAGELSDYRVIVLGVNEGALTRSVRETVRNAQRTAKIEYSDAARLFGTALAMNGFVEGSKIEAPEKLPRTIAYSSRIARSQWFADTFNDSNVKSQISRNLPEGRRGMQLTAVHMDAKTSAYQRGVELRRLNDVHKNNEARMICNVRIFTEGVDVPALDAVSFLDPSKSQIDIVQAVGRVMRKTAEKSLGYIIVPVFIPNDLKDIHRTLEQRGDGYAAIGQVLSALQAHDERLAESIARFLIVSEVVPIREDYVPFPDDEQGKFELKDIDADGIYAQVASASGLGKPGEITATTIEMAVKTAARFLAESKLVTDPIRDVLELPSASDAEVSTVAALLLFNACLMHKRLKDDVVALAELEPLDAVIRNADPLKALAESWNTVLQRDFEPIFRPALSLIEKLPYRAAVIDAIRTLTECAVNLDESQTDLGYDHAGPLYHRILGSARSDGAYYTHHVSALMLAGMALSDELFNWACLKATRKDESPRCKPGEAAHPDCREAIKNLKVLDPACGTGTLLMAALHTIKQKAVEHGAFAEEELPELHRHLVQHSIRGLDINYQATQLAAANLTLGAPSVDYEQMHIHTMQHGPTPEGDVKLGSLELLVDAVKGDQPSLLDNVKHAPLTGAKDLERGEEPDIRDVGVVLMNPPFTNNQKRGRQYGSETVKRMQARERSLKSAVSIADPEAGQIIDSNGLTTFFTALVEALVKESEGVVGAVVPTTLCLGASAQPQRELMADRFHVAFVVTSHDPKRINFSENTGINESLLVCRRRRAGDEDLPTTFISLRKMPSNAAEVTEWLTALRFGKESAWHRIRHRGAERMRRGEWEPAQWFDGILADVADGVAAHECNRPAGEMARIGCRGTENAFRPTEVGSAPPHISVYPLVWTHKPIEKSTLSAAPEFRVAPIAGRAETVERSLWTRASRLLFAQRLRTTNVRTPSIHLVEPVIARAWATIQPDDSVGDPLSATKAWNAFMGSTVGAISMLNARAKDLQYPAYSLDTLRSLPLPDPRRCDITPLVRAFDQLCDQELLPWPQMHLDPVRHQIDAAVCEVLSLDPAEVADWRQRIVAEPTVSNKPAP